MNWTCPICSKGFKTAGRLATHRKRHLFDSPAEQAAWARFRAGPKPRTSPRWQDDAACKGIGTPTDNPWFPDQGETPTAALAVCGVCPVRGECRGEWESMTPQQKRFGVWGGCSALELRGRVFTASCGVCGVVFESFQQRRYCSPECSSVATRVRRVR